MVQWRLSKLVVQVISSQDCGAAAISAPRSNHCIITLLAASPTFLFAVTLFNYMVNAALELHYSLLACGIQEENTSATTLKKAAYHIAPQKKSHQSYFLSPRV